MKRISTGLRICKCGKEMSFEEIHSCTKCATESGECRWCGKKVETTKS